MALPNPNRNISRMEKPSSGGWLVRIVRGDERIMKFFSDQAAGGKRLSQTAARLFRDETLSRLQRQGIRVRGKNIVCKNKRNRSGVIGVTRVNKKKADGTSAPYYLVTWHPMPGVQRTTSISILKYGEEKALKKACRIRNKGLIRRFGAGVFRKIAAKKRLQGQADEGAKG